MSELPPVLGNPSVSGKRETDWRDDHHYLFQNYGLGKAYLVDCWHYFGHNPRLPCFNDSEHDSHTLLYLDDVRKLAQTQVPKKHEVPFGVLLRHLVDLAVHVHSSGVLYVHRPSSRLLPDQDMCGNCGLVLEQVQKI